MPRRAKPPRLWLRPASNDRTATWRILDSGKQHATGCAAHETERAERTLAEYIAAKHKPPMRRRDIEEIPVADVLSLYIEFCQSRGVTTPHQLARLSRLAEFFGGMTLAGVTGETCRAYAVARGNDGGARRDLEDLRAAIKHHQKEGLHREIVSVVLPPKGEARDRWLTRSEAARLIWACWRARERQKRHRGAATGDTLPTSKKPLQHVARFILIGLYTGTRASAIATAAFEQKDGAGFVDLERGVFYRLPHGKRKTNKRQPPVRLPTRLLSHMRRWQANGQAYAVEWNGKPVASVKVGFGTAVMRAGLEGQITPHTLRHTAATWLMQNGADIWEAAGYLGMTVETLERVYGHHHPDHLSGAVEAIAKRPGNVAVSLPIA